MHYLSLFVEHLKEMIQGGVLWILVSLYLTDLVVHTIFPELHIPHFTYLLIIVLSLVWVGHETYGSVQNNTYISDLNQICDIAIGLNPSNPYSINKTTHIENGTLIHAEIIMHLVIKNSNSSAVRILSVGGEWKTSSLFDFLIPVPVEKYNVPKTFPHFLESGESLYLDLQALIFPDPICNAGQVATRLSKIIRKRATMTMEILNEADYDCINPELITERFEIPLAPLADLYISRWQELGRRDLVAAATSEMASA